MSLDDLITTGLGSDSGIWTSGTGDRQQGVDELLWKRGCMLLRIKFRNQILFYINTWSRSFLPFFHVDVHVDKLFHNYLVDNFRFEASDYLFLYTKSMYETIWENKIIFVGIVFHLMTSTGLESDHYNLVRKVRPHIGGQFCIRQIWENPRSGSRTTRDLHSEVSCCAWPAPRIFSNLSDANMATNKWSYFSN